MFDYGLADLSTINSIWDSLLHLTKVRPSVWFGSTSIPATVPLAGTISKPLKNLLLFLKNSCHKASEISYPCLLPLLVLLSSHLTSEFCDLFLRAFLEGFVNGNNTGNGGIAKVKARCFWKGYMECCLFIYTIHPTYKSKESNPKSFLSVHLLLDMKPSDEYIETLIEIMADIYGKETYQPAIAEFESTFLALLKDILQKIIEDEVQHIDELDISTNGILTIPSPYPPTKSLLNILSALKSTAFFKQVIPAFLETLLKRKRSDQAFLILDVFLGDIDEDDGSKVVEISGERVWFGIKVLKWCHKWGNDGMRVWEQVVMCVLEEGEERFVDMVQVFEGVCGPMELIDEYVLGAIENADGAIKRCVELGIVGPETLEVLKLKRREAIGGCAELLVISDRSLLNPDPAFLLRALFFLDLADTGDDAFEVLQLAVCDPGAGIRLEGGKDVRELLLRIQGLAREVLEKVWGHDGGEAIGARLRLCIENVSHCASTTEFVEMFRDLESVYGEDVWKGVFGNGEWREESLHFKGANCMALADSVLIWDESPVTELVLYDGDGMCVLSRRIMVILGLLKVSSCPPSFNWLYGEILRFLIVCRDSVFSSKAGPFLGHELGHLEEVEKEVLEVLETIGNSVKAGIANAFYLRSIEGGKMCVSEARVYGVMAAMGGMADLEFVERLSGLLDKPILFSATLGVVSSLQIESPKILEPVFENLVVQLLKIKRQKVVLEFVPLVLVTHILDAFEVADKTEDSIVSDSSRNSLVRWARVIYDAHINEPLEERIDGGNAVFDSFVAKLLALLVSDITREVVVLGLSTGKFLADLCLFWFKELQTSNLNAEQCQKLHQNLCLWRALQEAVEDDGESFRRVSDIENEVQVVIFDLFVQVCVPVMLSSSGMSKLQDLICEELCKFPVKMLRMAVSREEGAVNMLWLILDL